MFGGGGDGDGRDTKQCGKTESYKQFAFNSSLLMAVTIV